MNFRKTTGLVAAVILASAAAADGLTVTDGELVRDGVAFRAVGVNYYDGFLRHLRDGNDTSFEAGMAELGRRGIPLARFNAGGFFADDWDLYRSDPTEYFNRMDRFVDSARSAGVGLVPSLFWNSDEIAAIFGETRTAWTDVNSQTRAFARQYTADIVNRYRNNEAILMWEFGNEFNLQQDLPTTATRPAMPSDGVRDAVAEFQQTVRSLDPSRATTTGHSMARPQAWHLRNEDRFAIDSAAQFEEVTIGDHSAVDVISVHAYHQNTVGPTPNDGDAPPTRFGESDLTYDDVIADLMRISDEQNQPLFVGEFGVADDFTHGIPGNPNPTTEQRLQYLLDVLVDNEVPLSAIWVYDRINDDGTFTITGDNPRSYQLDLIAAANARLTAIPEPSSMTVIGFVTVWTATRRRRRARIRPRQTSNQGCVHD